MSLYLSSNIRIEVAYATTERQKIIVCSVANDCSLIAAVRQSGIEHFFPTINFNEMDLGIWGKVMPHEALVKEGQRIEIYRPLIIDPKESRRRRAQNRH